MRISQEAEIYCKAIAVLFGGRDLRGRLVTHARGARHLSLGIRLADPLKLDTAVGLAEPLALAAKVPAVIAQRLPEQPGLVTYQFQLTEDHWRSYTRADLTGHGVGVGLAESRRQVDFSFDPPHALVVGEPGSGKTETVKSILAGLLLAVSPADLSLVIVDPHRDFEDFGNVAHLVMPIATGQDEIDGAIRWIGTEVTRRKEANQRAGRRLVVVIDEAESTLDGQRLEIMRRVAAESRKFVTDLIISTQKPTQKNLPDLCDKLGNRFCGLVANAQVSAFLTGQAGLACHKLTGHGDFVHVAGATQERLQVAMATSADYARLLRAEIAHPSIPEPEAAAAIFNLEPEPEPAGGRPPTQLDARALAYYLVNGPESISINMARQVLGLARYAHVKHRDFAIELRDEVKKLLAARREGTQ